MGFFWLELSPSEVKLLILLELVLLPLLDYQCQVVLELWDITNWDCSSLMGAGVRARRDHCRDRFDVLHGLEGGRLRCPEGAGSGRRPW